MQIIPAILPKEYMELVDKFDTLKDYSSLIQIDFCDGVVGVEKTYIPKVSDPLSVFNLHQVQCDLMVKDWQGLLPVLSKVFPLHSVIIHLSSSEDVVFLKSAAEWTLDEGIGLGISITNDMKTEILFAAYDVVKVINPHVFIQMMGIRTIGRQGEPYDEEVEFKIKEIRKVYPEVYIQVDGSMSPKYAQKIKDAGADAAVVGSYLFSKPAYECFEEYALI